MCWPHVVAANLPFTGPAARCSAYRLNPAFHLFTTVAGRGAAGPSSNSKSSSTSTASPPGSPACTRDPRTASVANEKKLIITSSDNRNTTLLSRKAQTPRGRPPQRLIATGELSADNVPQTVRADVLLRRLCGQAAEPCGMPLTGSRPGTTSAPLVPRLKFSA